MKRKLFLTLMVSFVGAVVFGYTRPVPSFATVPGTNAGISLSTTNGSPNSGSSRATTSQDGRFIAYDSIATNLVSPSANGFWQIYVRDRLNNTTTMVSVSSSGTQGGASSLNPRISADGRYVVFESDATNLVSGDTNAHTDVFIHDRVSHTTQLVSVTGTGTQGNQNSIDGDVSADGRYVSFQSDSTNLITNPSVSNGSIYLKNLATGEVKLVSQSIAGSAANGYSYGPKISCEGRYVIFSSMANNLVSGDTNNPNKTISRLYVVDMLKAIDPVYLSGTANGSMSSASISCNGNYISFISDASNIVSGDTNNSNDVFVYDRISGTFDRISVSSDGTQANNYSSDVSPISNDGKYATFSSTATNLVSGDTNATNDVFLRNRQSNTTELISKNSSGTISNGYSYALDISDDGRYAVYNSGASNLVTSFGHSNGAIYAAQTGVANDY